MNKLAHFCLIVVEGKTDWIYVNEALRNRYSKQEYPIAFTHIVLEGKGNYNANSVIKKITKEIKERGKENLLGIVYCVDSDDYSNDPVDRKMNESIEKWCYEKKYRLVWMTRNIEEVFWGETVCKEDKSKRAISFSKNGNVLPDRLLRNNRAKGFSNLYCVMDELLIKK